MKINDNSIHPLPPPPLPPLPEDDVKLRRDRKQREFLFPGEDEQELDRLLGRSSTKRKRGRSAPKCEDPGDGREEEGVERRKKRKERGEKRDEGGEGSESGAGGSGGKRKEMKKDGLAGKSTLAPRQCWTKSDEDIVHRWAEKYVSKSRTETMREYAEKLRVWLHGAASQKCVPRSLDELNLRQVQEARGETLVVFVFAFGRVVVEDGGDQGGGGLIVDLGGRRRRRSLRRRRRRGTGGGISLLRQMECCLEKVYRNRENRTSSWSRHHLPTRPKRSFGTRRLRRLRAEESGLNLVGRGLRDLRLLHPGRRFELPKISSQEISSGVAATPSASSSSSSSNNDDNRAQTRSSTSFPRTLKFKNFDHLVQEDDLRNLVSPFGRLTSIQVIRDPRGYSQGFGFVEFERGEDAEEAMKRLNGRHHDPQQISLHHRRSSTVSLLFGSSHRCDSSSRSFLGSIQPGSFHSIRLLSTIVYEHSRSSIHKPGFSSSRSLPSSARSERPPVLESLWYFLFHHGRSYTCADSFFGYACDLDRCSSRNPSSLLSLSSNLSIPPTQPLNRSSLSSLQPPRLRREASP